MGTPGVPWVKDKDLIVAAIRRHKGRLTHACRDKSIDCAHHTLKKVVDSDPFIKQLVSDLRNDWVEDTLDQAEDVLSTTMSMVATDPNVALKSAMFYLNNQGKERKYAPVDTVLANKVSEDVISKLNQLISDQPIVKDQCG